MNRKILLLGIFIVLILGFFIFLGPKKMIEPTEIDDFASQAEPTEKHVPKSKQKFLLESENSVAQPRTPVVPANSGKYGLRLAASQDSMRAEIIRRDAYLKQNRTDLVIQSGDQSFVLMKLRAAKARSGSGKGLNHEIFPIDSKIFNNAIVDSQSYPVVYRESNGRLGLLTGILLVQTQDRPDAEKLALNYPVEMQTFDRDISMATYRVKDGEDLFGVYNRMKQNERIKSIRVEVLDSYKGH